MRIISCHIENFGKIHNFTHDFKPGLNVICKDNGWGKSTFAGFIKAMFYGFDGDRKRSISENERKKYKPWQGGVFGGFLVFETKGKTYRITRVFGDKEAADEFELRDEKTNLISEDFSSRVGEELFHIDKASFVRTVLIEQNGCSTEMTDGINAKIGNLADNTDDINNYETATKNITDMLNKMSSTRATGSISKRKKEIYALQVKIKDGKEIENGIDRCRALIEKAEEERTDIKAKIGAGQDVQKKVSSLQASLAKKREWKKLTEKEKEVNEKKINIRAKFPGDVPKKEEIDAAIKSCANMEQRKRSISSLMLTDAEKETLRDGKICFKDSIPSEKELSDMIAAAASYKDKKSLAEKEMPSDSEKERLSRLEKEFLSDTESASIMAGKWNERCNRSNAVPSKEAALLAMCSALEANKSKGLRFSPLLIIGILILAAGAVSFAFLPLWAAVIIAVAGAVLILCSILKNKPSQKEAPVSPEIEALQNKLNEDKRFIERVDIETKAYIEKHSKEFDENTAAAVLQTIIIDFVDYENLRERAEKAKKITKDASYEEEKAKIRSFLDSFGIDAAEDSCTDELYDLKAKRTEYVRLLEKLKSCMEEKTAYDGYAKELDEFYKKYNYQPKEDATSQLSDIRDNVFEYANAAGAYEDVKKELNEFKSNNKIDDIASTCEDNSLPTLDEINATLRQLEEKQENLHKQIVGYNQEMESLQEKYDIWEDDKARLEKLEEEQKEEMAKLKALTAVNKFLSSAKESIMIKYATPILESFKKYYAIVDEANQEKFHIDANTNITVNEYGMQRELDTQSTGYQDLYAVCLRAALVDAMYKDESPTVIMDDPFTNLDDAKAKKAKVFLEKFSEDYQTIYFTCSNSRA